AGHRAGHAVRHRALRRPRADPADAGAGHHRGRGRAAAGRQRLADVLAHHPAEHQVGPGLRRGALYRAGHGRVRRGVGGVRAYPRADQHPAAARRDSLQRIQPRRRLQRRQPAAGPGAGDPAAQAVERIAHRAPAYGSTAMSIEVRNVNKRFGQFQALNTIDLDIQSGELVALLGPSGCGKTSLLRIIAGLETPDTGSIVFHGEDVSGHDVRDRNVGFVFQHYALFRHMTVFDNVAFGLRMKPRRQRPSEAVIAGKVHELLGLVQLDWLADRYPEQLSGGQRQRIALARALAVGPRVLLLDEPFGALDAKVRKELRRWLARLHEDVHLTSVFVTHDQEEAMEVADRIVVMNKGVIEQIGTPAEVYRNPASEFVYHFLGDANRLQLDDERSVLFRPHEVSLSRVASAEHLPGEVRDIRPLGAIT